MNAATTFLFSWNIFSIGCARYVIWSSVFQPFLDWLLFCDDDAGFQVLHVSYLLCTLMSFPRQLRRLMGLYLSFCFFRNDYCFFSWPIQTGILIKIYHHYHENCSYQIPLIFPEGIKYTHLLSNISRMKVSLGTRFSYLLLKPMNLSKGKKNNKFKQRKEKQ